MALEDYYLDYYKQGEVEVSTPFPAPIGGQEPVLEDAELIRGLFVINQSKEATKAKVPGVSTRGTFATHSDSPISDRDVLRCTQINMYIRITGDPQTAPAKADTQVKTYVAEVIEWR